MKTKTVLTIEFDNDRIDEILPAVANIDGVAITAAINKPEPTRPAPVAVHNN